MTEPVEDAGEPLEDGGTQGFDPGLTLPEACHVTVALILGAGGTVTTAYRCAFELRGAA